MPADMPVKPDWDELVELAHVRWKGWSTSPLRRTTNGGLQPSSIDIVVSVVVQRELPRWAHDIARGDWARSLGTHVRLVAYIRTKENETMSNGTFLETIYLTGKHKKARNVCTYSEHVARHLEALADVTLFTKTNRVWPDNLKQVLGCATSRMSDVAHPWINIHGRRRFIDVICDDRWKNLTTLYNRVCPCKRSWPDNGQRKDHDDLLVACEPAARATPAFLRFVAHEQRLSPPLMPLVFERYAEGIWAVSRTSLLQHNRSLWSMLNDECDAVGEEDHDTNLQNFALLTAHHDPWRRYSYPPWLVSDSVQLYVDADRGLKRAEFTCER